MNVFSLDAVRPHTQARNMAPRPSWYTVSAGAVWKRYSDSQWVPVPASELTARAEHHEYHRREAMRAGSTKDAVYHGEHLTDLETAVAVLSRERAAS